MRPGMESTRRAHPLASYSYNTVNTLTFVFNNSSSSYTYSGGTLAAASAAIYFNGTLVGTAGDELSFDGGSTGLAVGTPISELNFTEKTNTVGTILVDDVVAVPEPGVTSLLFVAGILGIFCATSRRGIRLTA